MKKVGITGGIGSGKSTVAHLYEIMGYPIYYADSRAKWLMNNDDTIKSQLIASFGKKVYPEQLDRKALAKVVFSDKDALAKLNGIIHPSIEKDFNIWCETQTSPIIFKEAAILFESSSQHSVNKVICVTAPEITRVMRVMKRDNASAQQVQARIQNQWTDAKKAELADFVIIADDQYLMLPQALGILKELLRSEF